jgi:hypothetical protein
MQQSLDLVIAFDKQGRDRQRLALVASKAALNDPKAIEYWKTPGRKLTWANLKQSATGKKHACNIKDFGVNTFNKLKEIAKIK